MADPMVPVVNIIHLLIYPAYISTSRKADLQVASVTQAPWGGSTFKSSSAAARQSVKLNVLTTNDSAMWRHLLRAVIVRISISP